MTAQQALARVEQLVKDLALIAGAVRRFHETLGENAQSQEAIAERLIPVRDGIAQVAADAETLHGEISESVPAARKAAARKPGKSSKTSRKKR